MTIQSNVFAADLPAGSYTEGQVIALSNIYGSDTVLSGFGTPVMKEFISGAVLGTSTGFDIYVQNSSWIDPIINGPSNLADSGALDPQSTGVQNCHDCQLDIMSTWTVYAVCNAAITTSAAAILFAQIDIDYPKIAGVVAPANETGTPCSIAVDATVDVAATLAAASWTTKNVDIFKPNSKYLMEKLSIQVSGSNPAGFIAFANGADMGGLSRVIPVKDANSALSHLVTYAAAQTKGPMDMKYMLFATSAVSGATVHTILDYVKRAN